MSAKEQTSTNDQAPEAPPSQPPSPSPQQEQPASAAASAPARPQKKISFPRPPSLGKPRPVSVFEVLCVVCGQKHELEVVCAYCGSPLCSRCRTHQIQQEGVGQVYLCPSCWQTRS